MRPLFFMVITPHMLVGAAVGLQSNHLGLAFILGLLSHYLLDILPHWDYLSKITTKSEDLKKIGLDFLIGSLLVLILFWPHCQNLLVIVGGVIAALLPDCLQFIYYNWQRGKNIKMKFLYFDREPISSSAYNFKIKWLKPLVWFHQKIHRNQVSFWWGLPAMLIVSLAAVFSLLR
jgi:hypothetical protein